jgi:hypothetical protein
VFIYGKRKGDQAWDARVMEMIFPDLDHGCVDIGHGSTMAYQNGLTIRSARLLKKELIRL